MFTINFVEIVVLYGGNKTIGSHETDILKYIKEKYSTSNLYKPKQNNK